MGEDGHTASLFPGSDSLEEQNKWRGGVSERLKKTEYEILALQKMHNGRHPAVEEVRMKK